MLKFRDNRHFYIIVKILSVFMCMSLVVSVFFVSATAGQYTDSNPSVYHLANWYGLDELPYGNDSGVVYLKTWNSEGKKIDLTICFNKCSPLVDYVGDRGSVTYTSGSNETALIDNFTYSHIWGLQSGATSHGNSFYFSCISDTPVYYTYGNTGENWKTLPWSYISEQVRITQKGFSSSSDSGEVESNDVNVKTYRTIYVYLDVDLGAYGFSIPSGNRWYCYSNKLMTNSVSANYQKDYMELYAITFNTPYDSQYEGNTNYNTAKSDVYTYAFACYPSTQALIDIKYFEKEQAMYQLFYSRLGTISFDLSVIRDNIEYIYYNTDTIIENQNTIIEILQQLATGGETYPDDGLLNDKTYSDQVDGVIGDISTDTSSANFIHTLSASFIVIRGLWDKIVGIFGLYSVIGLLLFLAFTAYLLGRALKGRSD